MPPNKIKQKKYFNWKKKWVRKGENIDLGQIQADANRENGHFKGLLKWSEVCWS
jgi:hypothetical protein